MDEGKPLLMMEDVDFAPTGAYCGLSGISFTEITSKVLWVLGANGSGKTTLLHLLAGVIKPSTGHVLVCGHHVQQLKRIERITTINLILREFEAHLFCSTVGEILQFPISNISNDQQLIAQRINQSVGWMDIEHIPPETSPDECNLFERLRIAIASLLTLNPAILCLDEPFLHLDCKQSKHLRQLLATIPEIHFVLSSNCLEGALQNGTDASLVLDKGKLTFYGSSEDLSSNEDILRQAGLRGNERE